MSRSSGTTQLEIDFTPEPDISHGKEALEQVLMKAYRTDLESNNPRRRRKGVKGLASLPSYAAASIPVLEKALEDEDRNVQEAAAAALEMIRQCGRQQG